MAETLRELVVALSLDSSNFSRNMRTINQQIKEAESTFRLAGAGVQNYEKTMQNKRGRCQQGHHRPEQRQGCSEGHGSGDPQADGTAVPDGIKKIPGSSASTN